jgi:hypothetical protein
LRAHGVSALNLGSGRADTRNRRNVVNNTHQIETFIALLDRQAALIGELASHEGALQQIVSDRDWESLQEIIPRMTKLSASINELEEHRNRLFQTIAADLGGEESFGRVLMHLPGEIRSELSAAYRRLKVAVLALQSRTTNIDSYLRASIATSRGILQELYPEHTAHGYSRDGQGRFGTEPAVMLDRSH